VEQQGPNPSLGKLLLLGFITLAPM